MLDTVGNFVQQASFQTGIRESFDIGVPNLESCVVLVWPAPGSATLPFLLLGY